MERIYDLNPQLKRGGPSADHCPAGGGCEGTGWVLDEETNTAHPCACRDQRIAHARNRALHREIPRRFQSVGFEREPVKDLDPDLVRHVRMFSRRIADNLDKGRGLWFFGPTGTGKTALAMVVAHHALRENRSVVIRTGPDLLTEIRNTYNDESPYSYSELMQRLASVDLLLVDDLAVERANEWVLEQLYTVINDRYQEMRSVLITTNLERPETLRDHIGDRSYSRIVEMAGPALPVLGPDRRLSSYEVAAELT